MMAIEALGHRNRMTVQGVVRSVQPEKHARPGSETGRGTITLLHYGREASLTRTLITPDFRGFPALNGLGMQ
jgi:hypothetical protein